MSTDPSLARKDGFKMSDAENLKKRLQLGAKGKAILFAGAGCSFDCVNYENEVLPTVNPLLSVFNQKLGKEISRIDIAASMLLDRSKEEYLNLLNDTFFVRSVPEDLVDLMQFEWDRVYTTNYDNALEVACARAGKKARPLVPTDDSKNQPKENLQIVHLHGYIERFTTDNVQRDCILDYNSNVANEVYDGPWADRLRLDISNADVVVFVGYSLYDPEIAKLIRAAEYTKEKVFFINGANASEELRYMQGNYGASKDIERDGLARILSSAKKQGQKANRETFVCFKRVPETTTGSDIIKKSDLDELFIFGNFDWTKAQSDAVSGTQKYIIRRDLVGKVSEYLENGEDFISVFSPLGYGKT